MLTSDLRRAFTASGQNDRSVRLGLHTISVLKDFSHHLRLMLSMECCRFHDTRSTVSIMGSYLGRVQPKVQRAQVSFHRSCPCVARASNRPHSIVVVIVNSRFLQRPQKQSRGSQLIHKRLSIPKLIGAGRRVRQAGNFAYMARNDWLQGPGHIVALYVSKLSLLALSRTLGRVSFASSTRIGVIKDEFNLLFFTMDA